MTTLLNGRPVQHKGEKTKIKTWQSRTCKTRTKTKDTTDVTEHQVSAANDVPAHPVRTDTKPFNKIIRKDWSNFNLDERTNQKDLKCSSLLIQLVNPLYEI